MNRRHIVFPLKILVVLVVITYVCVWLTTMLPLEATTSKEMVYLDTLTLTKLEFEKHQLVRSGIQLIINEPDVCLSHSSPFMVTIVHTAPTNTDYRNLIRQTWGSTTLYKSTGNKVLFVLGTVANDTQMEEIREESDTFHDIIQGNFIDSYRNLTLKTIVWMEWFSKFCPKAKFLLKSDDDMLINTVVLSKTLRKLSNLSDTVFCRLWRNGTIVIRNPKSKWYITKEERQDNFYPEYCWGWAYIITGDLAVKMHRQSLKTRFYWIDDYFVTGTIISALNGSRLPLIPHVETIIYGLRKEENLTEDDIFINDGSVERRSHWWTQMVNINKDVG